MPEHRLMYSRLRIAVAELSHQRDAAGVLKIKVFKRALRCGDTACFCLARVPSLGCRRIKFRAESI